MLRLNTCGGVPILLSLLGTILLVLEVGTGVVLVQSLQGASVFSYLSLVEWFVVVEVPSVG